MAVTFFHGHGSPYSWRVWLALEHLRVPYELKVLSFAEKDTRKPEFLAVNPRGQVPTIQDGEVVLWESIPILEYLDEEYGVNGPARLYPGTPAERAKLRRLVREIELYLGAEGIDPVVDEYFYKGDAAPDAERLAKAKVKTHEELMKLVPELKAKYFGGEGPNIVDIALYPIVGYIGRITKRKPESGFTEVIPKELKEWGARFEALPYFDKTIPSHWR